MVDPAVRRASALAALGLAAATACGGISQRHVDDGEAGSGGTGADGGSFSGGNGGAGGRATTGGSGGSDDGGASFTGGSGGNGGTVSTGGTGAVGGSFTGGTGGSFTGGNGAMGGNFTTGGAGGAFSTGGTIPVAGSGGTPADPYRIPWQFNGYIAPETNVFGIAGGFYFSTDCASAAGSGLPCTQPDPNLLGGDGQYGWAVSETVACARGVASQVTSDPVTGEPAYALQWGALLGIALYRPGDSVFDAKAQGIAGFRVDIVGVAPSDVRVNFVTPETIGSSHFITVTMPSPDRVLMLDEALQGSWVFQPVPLDVTRLSGIEFHVYTDAAAPKPFDFCITNLRAIPW